MAKLTPFGCAEAFKRLDDFLDRELTPEEMQAVKEHLEICQVCATEFKFEDRVLRQVRSKLSHIDLPPELLERVAKALDDAEG